MTYRRIVDENRPSGHWRVVAAIFLMTFAFAFTETSQIASRDSIPPIGNENSLMPGCRPTSRFIEWTPVDDAFRPMPDNDSIGYVTINWTQAVGLIDDDSNVCIIFTAVFHCL